MTQAAPSQSQPCYFSLVGKSRTQHSEQTSHKLNGEEVIDKLADKMKKVDSQEFQDCLKDLSNLIKQGYGRAFYKHSTVMRKIMNHFTKLSKALENDNHQIQVQFKMIFSLSVIAQLIKQNPKVYFPFTRKFLSNIFLIDQNLLLCSPYRRNILAILGVVFENLSRQVKLLEKYQMVDTLKKAILGSYALIDELFTLKVFNKTIMNLIEKGVNFSGKQFEENQILETVSHFISKSQVDLFLLQAKIALIGMGSIFNEQKPKNQSFRFIGDLNKSLEGLK